MVEIRAHAPNDACIRVDGLGPQALEFEMLEMGLVALLEVGGGGLAGVAHTAISWAETLHNHLVRIDAGEICSVDRFRGYGGWAPRSGFVHQVASPRRLRRPDGRGRRGWASALGVIGTSRTHEMSMNPDSRVVVALDFESGHAAMSLVEQLGQAASFY